MQGENEQMKGRMQQARGTLQRLSGRTSEFVGTANQQLGSARAGLGQTLTRFEGTPWAGIGGSLLAFTLAAGAVSLFLFPSMRGRLGVSMDSLPGRSRPRSLTDRVSDVFGDLLASLSINR
ncbi:MAG: hypothetical protein M1401_02325 [Chloroflexi bacterium]|nr:hypothetical protein [Chloroflexota bacterium]MCL5107711.1 hypothetical protein [Chloroflexota bacterium]